MAHNPVVEPPRGARYTRRAAVAAGILAAGAASAYRAQPTLATATTPPELSVRPALQATPVPGAQPDQAAAIMAVARDALATKHLKAVIFRVVSDGQEVITGALGESMTGVPATVDMHFRNGAVEISYMSTLLLHLVDQGVVSLDDPLSTWLPDLPDADQVTLLMLANMTAGYPDYVQTDQFGAAFYADPFRQWTPEELIEIGLATPRAFAPGTNWAYAHTNYVILGRALERIGGQPLDALLRANVLDPLGLSETQSFATATIPEPVLHAFTSERRSYLGIPSGTAFYEESTFWNPSWTLAGGAIQTTNIYDMTATAVAIGEGTLLSPQSHQTQVAPTLVGFGTPQADCRTCRTLNADYAYGLGVVLSRAWILQNPLFAGCGAIEAYLPARKLAIAVATTFRESAFAGDGSNPHNRASWEIFAAIAALLAPEDAPPATRS